MDENTRILEQLMDVLRQRRDADPDSSYVASLYRDGIPAITAKITEEAVETVEAAEDDPERPGARSRGPVVPQPDPAGSARP